MARTDKNNVTRYWWDSHIPGLSLMSADFTSHDYATHTHDAFVIAISELGSAKIKSRGTVETVHSTRLFVSNPEEPQSSSMAGSTRWRYRSIYLTSAGIVAVTHGLGIEEVPYFTKNVIDDSNLVSCFGSLHRAFEAGADPFLRHELLICACERLFRGHGSAALRMKSAPPRPDGCAQSDRAHPCSLRRSAAPQRACCCGGNVCVSAYRPIQANRWNDAACIFDPRPAERRLSPLEAGAFNCGDGGNRRILRSERSHASFQELLRHHAYAICQCRQSRPELPTSQLVAQFIQIEG